MTDGANNIRTEPKPECALCGHPGTLLYAGLKDRLFDAPGEWSLKRCSNEKCGLLWLDPAPLRDDIWKAYVNYYTHQDGRNPSPGAGRRLYHCVRNCYLSLKYGYFEQHAASKMKWLGLLLYLLPGKRTDADFSVMCLPRKPGGRLLEIGCGSGTMLEYIGSLGWEVEGADVDSSAVVNARKKGLKVSHGSIEELCYGENTFDAITISHVIEHVPDPVRLISECFRILKPGGTLSLVTPNTESFGLSVFSESWLSLDPPRHLMLFNVKTIRQLARSAGFSDVQAKTTIREVHSLVWASYSISRHGYFAFGSVPPKCVRFILLLVRLIVYGGVKIFPNKGEEISLMAIK